MDRRQQSSVAEIQKEPVFVFGGNAKERGKGGRRHLEGNAWKRGKLARTVEPGDDVLRRYVSNVSVGAHPHETGK